MFTDRNFIVCGGTRTVGSRKTIANFDPLNSLNPHQGRGKAGIQTTIPMHI